MIFKKLKNKKGFSLVEVAIAMAVVSIVTITAIAIIYPATDKTKEANAQSNAIYFAADAIECFKATDNDMEFQFLLLSRGGMNKIEDRSKLPVEINTLYSDYQIFRADGGNYFVGLKVDSPTNTLNIIAVDSRGNSIFDRNLFPTGVVEYKKASR